MILFKTPPFYIPLGKSNSDNIFNYNFPNNNGYGSNKRLDLLEPPLAYPNNSAPTSANIRTSTSAESMRPKIPASG